MTKGSFFRIRRIRAKWLWISLLCPVFAFLYHICQRTDIAPVQIMSHDTLLLGLVPVDYNAVWLYLSMYPLLLLVAAMLPTSRLVHRYGASLAVLGLISCYFFLFFPSAVPRPELSGDIPALYRWLIQVDLPRNAFPSLHASLSMLGGLFFHHMAGRWKRGVWLARVGVWIWVGGIFWSTIALRQHVLFDLLTGGSLGFFVGLAALRYPKKWLRGSSQQSGEGRIGSISAGWAKLVRHRN